MRAPSQLIYDGLCLLVVVSLSGCACGDVWTEFAFSTVVELEEESVSASDVEFTVEFRRNDETLYGSPVSVRTNAQGTLEYSVLLGHWGACLPPGILSLAIARAPIERPVLPDEVIIEMRNGECEEVVTLRVDDTAFDIESDTHVPATFVYITARDALVVPKCQ